MAGLWILAIYACLHTALAVDYSGYEVLRFVPEHDVHLKILSKIHENREQLEDFDFWKEPTILKQPVVLMVKKETSQKLQGLLAVLGLKSQVVIDDVQERIDLQVKDRRPMANIDHTQYHTLEEIEEWMEEIVASHSDIAEIITVGTSYEGRDVKAIKITNGTEANKRTMWIDSGIHSREWVSIAMMVYFVEQFLTGFGRDDDITQLVNDMDWYMLPVYNPDGYEYTWTDDRLWRKTRSVNEGSLCRGCDPNRNWDFQWSTVGTSPNPCSQIFAGPAPFSEIEVREVAYYIGNITNLQGYIAYHSFGQMYMLPWGYTEEQAPDFEELMTMCRAAVDDLEAVDGEVYTCDSLINLVGPSSGSSVDYVYGSLGIKYSFGVELRDVGFHGFTLPPEQILPTSQENMAALLSLAKHINDHPVVPPV